MVVVRLWFGAGDKVDDFVRIEATIKKEDYHDILQRHAIPCGKQLIGHRFIFQQDNDPKHTSTLCKTYMKNKEKQKKLVNMDWPPQSPDLNYIGLLWDELDREVRKLRPTNRYQFWEYFKYDSVHWNRKN